MSAIEAPPPGADEATPVFTITRRVAAPRELAWRAWTEERHLARWWGPKGCTITQCRLDLRPGGTFHYCMGFPGHGEMWGKFVFREIVAPERLVFLSSFSDPQGGTTRAPFEGPPWPLEMLTAVTFADAGGSTTITVRSEPFNADAVERRTFADGMDSMNTGWSGTFDRLDAFLETRDG